MTLAFLAVLLQVGQPRWAALQGIRLGGPEDDILAKGGECRPGGVAGPLGPGMSSFAFAQATFGYALPHSHQPRDSSAIRRALGVGTLCRVQLDSSAHALAAAMDRRVVAVIVYFVTDSGVVPADSVRRLAYAAWGRPTHHSPNLDTWSNSRYRSYLLVPYRPAPIYRTGWMTAPQLIMFDIAACTAFDRRAHRAGAVGEAGEC